MNDESETTDPRLTELRDALRRVVEKAVVYGEDEDGFIQGYIQGTGAIHNAIRVLQNHGITARPHGATEEQVDDGQGHLFRFTVVSQGRYTVTGRDGYTDADWGLDDDPWTAEVRAWDLPTALRRLADRGLTAWDTHEDPS